MRGTGFRIGPGRVLTAQHVVERRQRHGGGLERASRIVVRLDVDVAGEVRDAPARWLWSGSPDLNPKARDTLDVALLADDLPTEGLEPFRDFVPKVLDHRVEWETRGFPVASREVATGGGEYLSGACHPTAERASHIALTSIRGQPRDPKTGQILGWAGASGAPIFVDGGPHHGALYGVLRAQPFEFDDKIWAVALPVLLRESDFRQHLGLDAASQAHPGHEIRPDPRTITCDLPNLGTDRWVRVVDGDQRSKVLGSGFRLDARRVLTASQVACSSRRIQVCDPHGSGFKLREARRLWPEEGAEGCHVALLETDAVPSIEPFELSEPPRIEGLRQWKSVAYPADTNRSSRRLGIGGTIEASGFGSWHIGRLAAGPQGFGDLQVLPGSAVFVDTAADPKEGQGPSWSLLGILEGASTEEGWRFEVHSLADLLAWLGLDVKSGQRARKAESPRSLRRVENLLRSQPSRAAIVGSDPEGRWKDIADRSDDRALAKALCHETAPHDLALRLASAYSELVDSGNGVEARRASKVLMEALPAALDEYRLLPLPDARATEIRLGLAGRILVDFALAAAESGAAAFLPSNDKDTSDIPFAAFQVRRPPGELGYDDGEEEVAKEVARDVELRAILHSGTAKLSEIIGRWAACRPDFGGARWLDPEVLKDMGDRRPGQLLDEINNVLATPTIGSGRHFYFLASQEESKNGELKPLVASLRQILPQLKIVTLEGSQPGAPEYRQLRESLVEFFNLRRQLEGSDS